MEENKKLAFFDDRYSGYWILKCPNCAMCQYCSNIWYDYTHGPYMAFCELDNANASMLGADCNQFELDVEDEHICELRDLEAKINRIKDINLETSKVMPVLEEALSKDAMDWLEKFAHDLGVPVSYFKKYD